MGLIQYALFTYALTAVIAVAVIALIVFVNHLMSKNNTGEEVE